MMRNLDAFEPLSAPVRAMCAHIAAGNDLGEVVATWLCQTAAVHDEGLCVLTINRPLSWEAELILRLATGTVGEDAEFLDAYEPKLARFEGDPVRLPCPKCHASGARPYTGRSGDPVRLPCMVCEGTGTLAGLIAAARGEEAGQRVLVRLVAAVEAFEDARTVPAGRVRLSVDVPADVAQRLAELDAYYRSNTDIEGAAAAALRLYAESYKPGGSRDA